MTLKAPSMALLLSLRHAMKFNTSSVCHSCSRTRSFSKLHSSDMQQRNLSSSSSIYAPVSSAASPALRSRDRGPASKEDTQTDFGIMDVFANTPAPSAAIDACLPDGFHLDNGVKITGGSGLLLVSGEAFAWRPWEGRGRLVNRRGQWDTGESDIDGPEEGRQGGAWGLLELCWPKPEMLILGLGPRMYPLAPQTRERLSSLGIRVDVSDTRNAAAQFNLLATERGVGNVAAALIPLGWNEPR